MPSTLGLARRRIKFHIQDSEDLILFDLFPTTISEYFHRHMLQTCSSLQENPQNLETRTEKLVD